MQKKKVTIGLVQSAASSDIESNVKKALENVKVAAKKGSKIVCLQELYNVIYFPQYRKKNFSKFAETIPGTSTKMFSKLAKELGIVIILPLFERKGNRHYNSAVVIKSDGKLMETYRKLHIPHDQLFYEKNYFDEGNLGYRVYKTKFANFAALICYDQWFPESARIAALKGADIIFYPTAIGYIKDCKSAEGDWQEAWETVQRSHAIANGVHVAAVNRVGQENKLQFWGGSFVCDAFGRVLKRAKSDEQVLVVTIDISQNKKIQDGWGFLRNRRPDTYELLVKNKK
ncbi:MAG: carbon-nitrogen hydrolase [Nanoarchaeota archaeon]